MVDEFGERTVKKGKRPDLFVDRLKCSLTQSQRCWGGVSLKVCSSFSEKQRSQNYSWCKNRLLNVFYFTR